MIARYDAKGRRWPAVAAGLGIVIGAAALSGVTRAADQPKPPAEPGRPPAAVAPGAPAARQTPPGVQAPRPAPPRLPGMPGMPGEPGFAPPLPPPPTAPPAAAKPGASAKDAHFTDDDPANARTAEKLQKPVKVEFQGQSLSDVLDFIRDQAGVDILVQWPQLETAGLNRDTPVTLKLREPTPVGSVLSLIFRTLPVKLEYEIDKGVVVIGAADPVGPAEVTRVYDVSDLVMFRGEVPPGSVPGGPPGVPGMPGGFGGGGGGSPMAVVIPDEVAQLMHLIQTTVQPDTWRESGGQSGSITSFKGKLVIKATEPVHKEVSQLLEMLRETPGGKKAK